MDAFSLADQAPRVALFCGGIEQPWKPVKRRRDDPAVHEINHNLAIQNADIRGTWVRTGQASVPSLL